jgi:hypothetical protein
VDDGAALLGRIAAAITTSDEVVSEGTASAAAFAALMSLVGTLLAMSSASSCCSVAHLRINLVQRAIPASSTECGLNRE